jgi:acyl-CoA reductase-like NAD-dependent aldehyde dehydrogenase
MDNGLPINRTKFTAMPATIDVLEVYAGLTNKLHGEILVTQANRINYTLREPFGVVGAIVPWNFPLILTMWKLAPVFTAGNTLVIKLAGQTPFSILELVKIFQEVGLSDGVINVIPVFGHTAGAAIVSHPGIDRIAFPVSNRTGQQSASKNLKPFILELGGVTKHNF